MIGRRLKALSAAVGGAAVLTVMSGALAQDKTLKVTLAGGSVGGAWSAMGSAIGEAIRRQSPGAAFTYEPGRDAANVQLVAQKRVELAIAHAQIARRAAAGEAPFAAKIGNVKGVAMLDKLATLQVIAAHAFGAASVEEIGAKKLKARVALNVRGSLMAITGEELLKAAGAPVKDLEAAGGKVHYVAYNDGLEMLKSGQVDIVVNMLEFPSRQLVNATRDLKVRFLPMSAATAGALNAALGTSSMSIPAGTYPFQSSAIETISGHVVLLAADETSAEVVATTVRAMLKNFDYLKAAHAALGRLTPADLPLTPGVELHPAAAAVYKEAGLLK
ncbi:MAG TPA: TAXI family TRAP transporter solute-binding subunit [Hyphomicrobiaceae bacterium]|nr:TAXI family TRAP transporter solute-binding subunit [Hyphomicrobiaceae bacterium]